MTINRNDLFKLPILYNPVTSEILKLVTTCKEVVTTSEGTGQHIKRCLDIIIEDKNNTLFVVDNKIIGRCDSKGDNYSACKACVYALNESAASNKLVNTKPSTHSIDDDGYAHGDYSFM